MKILFLAILLPASGGWSVQAQRLSPSLKAQCREEFSSSALGGHPKEHSPMREATPAKCHTFYALRGITHVDTLICQRWDTLVNIWVNDFREIMTYNANEKLSEGIEYNWNSASSTWYNSWRSTYTYDVNNNLTEFIEYTWNGASWDNVWRITYTYDANNNLTEEIDYNWNSASSTWDNAWRYTYTYDANNNLTEGIYYTWNSASWDNDWRYTYTYDANNNLTEEIGYNWTGSAWRYASKCDYTNNLITGIPDAEGKAGVNVSVYPNPFTTSATLVIASGAKQSHPFTFIMYDLLGREVMRSVILMAPQRQKNLTIQRGTLPAGMYFYKVTGDRGQGTREIIATGKIIIQ